MTGDTDDPTQLAWRFSPVSNNKRTRVVPDQELDVLVATDVLSEGQNLQDAAIVVNYDLPWAIIRLVQRAGRVDRIGQQAETILCYSFLPADGVERIIRLRARVRQRLQENAEVVGTDEAFFEDDSNDQAIRDLFTEKAGILDGDADTEVDLGSYAFQIWKNAIDRNPSLQKIIADLPNVVYSTKPHVSRTEQPEGVLVYVRTAEGNDALAWVDKQGNPVTESQFAILRAAMCEPDTPALPRHDSHHDLVHQGVERIASEEKTIGGQLGRPSGARFRTYERLKRYADAVKDTLFDSQQLRRAIEDIYSYPLRQVAIDILNRQLRSGISDADLAQRVIDLREEDRLCIIHEEEESQEPRIICSLGLADQTGEGRYAPCAHAVAPRESMTLSMPRIRHYLREGNLEKLFIEELGWDRHAIQLTVAVDGHTYTLRAIAEKRGVQIFECQTDAASSIPGYATRRKLETQITKSAYEHLIIFVDAARTMQIWQWVARQPGQPTAYREHHYHAQHQSGDALIQKLEAITFSLNEEEGITLTGVVFRLRDAFDRDRITRRFYDHFKREHAAFLAFIKGITEQGDREWYASLMLNRLMFVYFIQCKGFLNGDTDYLKNRLRVIQERQGKGKFLTFYRYFLLRLFHEGFAQQPAQRAADLEALLGEVPYLNGGLFELHTLEQKHTGIDIPDEAFEHLFAFFDQYDWHLDTRPLRNDREINPDVLGYIFEKYINQKQMGAYYTKEDITEYIAKNTVIPYLFDAAQKKCAIAFQPDSALWRLLRDDPDRYIYEPGPQRGGRSAASRDCQRRD